MRVPAVTRSQQIGLGVLAVAILAGSLGLFAGDRRARGGQQLATARERIAVLEGRVARLEQERDRVRHERNLLEARLAAGEAPPVCPAEYVSTGALLPWFAVDLPCGWHALYDPTSPVGAEDRPGLHAEVLVLARLPISLAPRSGPVGDFELADWTDAADDDLDALPPLATWVEEERALFSAIQTDDRFEGGDGVTVHRLIGTQVLLDEPQTVHVLLWRYRDALSRARHVVRAFALAPSPRAADAVERLARSFRILDRD